MHSGPLPFETQIHKYYSIKYWCNLKFLLLHSSKIILTVAVVHTFNIRKTAYHLQTHQRHYQSQISWKTSQLLLCFLSPRCFINLLMSRWCPNKINDAVCSHLSSYFNNHSSRYRNFIIFVACFPVNVCFKVRPVYNICMTCFILLLLVFTIHKSFSWLMMDQNVFWLTCYHAVTFLYHI